MRYATVLLVALMASVAIADEPAPVPAPTTQPANPLAESRRVDAQLEELERTDPIGKKMAELARQIRELEEKQNEPRNELYRKMENLVQSEAGLEYMTRRRAIEAKNESAWSLERRAMGEAAKAIYAARHEELLRLAPATVPNAVKLGFDVLNYPRIDGSTSTHPLSVILAARVLNVDYRWAYPEPDGSYWPGRPRLDPTDYLAGGMSGALIIREREFNIAASRVVAKGTDPGRQRVAVMINSLLATHTNTHDAYVNLIEGKCDLGLIARAPSESELKLAQDKGVKIAHKPIARDALVFIVNHDNPLGPLTLQQVRDIYEGKISVWSELVAWDKLDEAERRAKHDYERTAAKEHKKIVPLRRERDSGSRELFDALVMNGKQLPEPEHDWRIKLYASSMSGPYNRVTREINALGYSVYYYEHFMAMSPYTRTIAIEGVEPSYDTIASGKYPLVAEVYAAYREDDPPESPARKLLAWLLSPEGQAVVRESGYVPVK